MSFGLPGVLWLLIPIALCWFLEIRRRVSLAPHWPKVFRLWAGPDSLDLKAHAKPPKQRWRLWIGLGLATTAMAQPRWGHVNTPLFSQSRDVVIALDLSRSMMSRDVEPSRLEHAKFLIQSMLDQFAGERVGLLLFSRTAFLQIPLTADYEVLESSLADLSPNYFPHSSTNYGPMLKTALQSFGATQDAERFLVVLSDGESFDEDWRPLLQQFKERGIHIVSLGIGTAAGGAIPDGEGGTLKDATGGEVLTQLKAASLEELSKVTNGLYADGNAWVDMADLLKRSVESGHKEPVYKKDQALLQERFQYALVPAVILLLISFWRELPVRPRSRELKFRRPETETSPARGGTRREAAVAVSLFLVLLAGVTGPARAQDAPPVMTGGDMDESAVNNIATNSHVAPVGAFGEMLRRRVDDIVKKRDPNAYDYSSLAIDTITYVEGTLRIRKQVAASVIDDALKGLDIGQAMDAEGGNWVQLRGDLLELRRKNLLPPYIPPPDKPTAKELLEAEEEEKNGKKLSAGHKVGADDDKPVGFQPPADMDEPKKDLHIDAAFGDMKLDPNQKINLTIPPESLPPADAQKVGGAPTGLDKETLLNPGLALPLQKLQLVRQGDTPGKFFQMLDNDKEAPISTGPEW